MRTKLFLTILVCCSLSLFAQQEGKPAPGAQNITLKDTTKTGKENAKKGDKANPQKSSVDTLTLDKDCNHCGAYSLIYDFKCKKFYYHSPSDKENVYTYLSNLENLKVNYKEGLRFKIININRYLYETSLSYDDVVLKSEQSAAFKNLFLGGDLDFKLPIIANKEKAPTTHDSLGDKEISRFTKKDNFVVKLHEFKQLYNGLLENYLSAYSLCKKTALCCSEAGKTSYTDLSDCLFELRLAFDEYKSEAAFSKSTVAAELTKLKAQLASLEGELEKAKEVDKKSLQKKIEDKKAEIKGQENLMEGAESEEAGIAEFKTTLDKLTDEKLMEVIHFGNNLLQDNYEYNAPTIYPTGDRLLLNLKISPNTADGAKKWQVMSLDSDDFNLEFQIRNKWFFSFSTGPFVGLSGNFRVNTYGWQKLAVNEVVGADSKYRLVHTGHEGAPVGIAGFANFGTHVTDWYGLGVSIGAGATVLNDTRLAYFAGITQFFGQDNQFNLTAGLAFMQVNELDRKLYPDDLENTQYDATFDLSYTKKFATGFFVSVSYTLFDPSKTRKGTSSGTTAGKAAKNDEEPATTTTETKTETKGDTAGSGKSESNDNSKKTVTSTKVSQSSGLDSVIKSAKKIKIKN